MFTPPAVADLNPETEQRVERNRVLGALKRFTESVADDRVELRAQAGSAIARTIACLAEELRADLLVLGSHGRSGFDRLLLGSISEKAIRLAPCATLVVPRRAGDPPDGPIEFRRIVCAVDFSDVSLRALEQALTMAGQTAAELTVLHVYNMPPDLVPAAASNVQVAAGIAADRTRLDHLIPEDASRYSTVETLVRQGAVHREILAVAADRHADLIVMGVHGRGALDVMLFGSNTARVARHSMSPVLIVQGK